MSGELLRQNGKTIIAADDQPENLLLLESIIAARGYMFFGADSGMECLSLAARVSPRLILLDVQMPEMDGFETCRRLRAMRELLHTPIAFLTARKTSADVRAGMDAGGNDFLVKPFDPAKLIMRVDHWAAKRIG